MSSFNDLKSLNIEDHSKFIKKEKPNLVQNFLLKQFEIETDSAFSVDIVKFCPFEQAADLLICQTSSKIGKLSIYQIINLKNEIKIEFLEDIVVGSRINQIAWSPNSTTNNRNGIVKLGLSLFNNNQIQIITSNIDLNNTKENDFEEESFTKEFRTKNCVYLNESDCVNDLAFEPITGEFLASVGDDKLCSVWNSEDGNLCKVFKLTSPGVSVKWHTAEPNKLMVAEEAGIIRFYDLQTKTPLISFTCDHHLLLSADWCKTNNFLIGCTSGTEAIFWNITESSYPIEKFKAHIKGGQYFEFYNDNIYASRGRPNSQILVQNRKTNQILLDEQLKSGNGITWHLKSPLLAAGHYNKIIIYHLAIFT